MSENTDQEYVKIAVLESIVEAQILGSILKEDNIPHLIRSYHDTAYDGLYQLQKGWGKISSPLSHKENILKILDEVRAENYDMEDGEDANFSNSDDEKEE